MSTTFERKLGLVQAAIDSARGGTPDNFETWKEQARTALPIAFGPDDEIIARFDRISFSLASWSPSQPPSASARAKEFGVKRAIAMLEGAKTEMEVSEPDGPLVDVSGRHPWVNGTAASLWDDGHHRQAVEEAARSVEIHLKA